MQDLIKPYLSLSLSAARWRVTARLSGGADRPIEDGVNELLYRATALTLRIVTLGAPLLAPILDVTEAAQFLAIGTLGFIGPLISGTGGLGHAVQDLVDSDNFNNSSTILWISSGCRSMEQSTAAFGPNLQPLLPFLPTAIPLVDPGCAAGPGD